MTASRETGRCTCTCHQPWNRGRTFHVIACCVPCVGCGVRFRYPYAAAHMLTCPFVRKLKERELRARIAAGGVMAYGRARGVPRRD